MKTLALVLAIVFFILAILCFTGMASFMPAIGIDGTHHTKHGIAYFILAILCVVWMRMAGGSTVRR
ncbi:MAG: hypothetical protein GIW97_02365 [Candidatus Eremiobacteraeota bacterium]|nr:hypothetical protein [Candidatus Eremiobacteraeota bacterium]